jgi:hypothetical protein
MEPLEQRITQGDQARQVLENPAFAKAFADIEQEHVEAWKNSPARDPAGRETLWMTVKLLHKLRSTLESAMTDGKLANVELEYQNNLLTKDRAEGVSL